eukprot:4750784-Prorocentrum_lima.AAC.1
MTSSLVGSEMCIRDSIGVKTAEEAEMRACTWALLWVLGSRPKAEVPVSYTHLTLPTICSV